MRIKCLHCGLVNFAHSEGCRRCQTPFGNMSAPPPMPVNDYAPVNNYYPPPAPMNYGPAVAPYPNQYPPYQPAATVYTTSNLRQYYGIRGWLILPAIGLVFTPVLLCFNIMRGIASYNMMAALEHTPGLELSTNQFRSVLILETLCNVFLLIFALSLAVQFFKKKKMAPNLFIAFLAINMMVALFDYFIAQSSLEGFMLSVRTQLRSPDSTSILRSFYIQSIMIVLRAAIPCLIWIPYFRLSKRVKATFIH